MRGSGKLRGEERKGTKIRGEEKSEEERLREEKIGQCADRSGKE